jgi:hypothetical protein
MVTIKEYLQKPNPALQILASTSQSTNSEFWEPIEEFELFDDFNYETLKNLYGDVLKHDFDAKLLPTPNKLLAVETKIYSERELEQDPLKRYIIAKANYSVKCAYNYLDRKEPNNDFKDPPAIVCGTKEPSGGPVPDWIGSQTGYQALLCGETKLSTVFSMHNTTQSPDRSLDTPVEQCLHYCILKDTRYGFMITDKELVVFRVRQEDMEAGIAAQRPRRAMPSVSYSHGGSSLVSSTQGMSLYSNFRPQGSPKYIQYRTVPWSAENGLTVCLALFLITMIAYAPTIDVDIKSTYKPLDSWEWDEEDANYRNNTSGRVQKKLQRGQLETVQWTERKDENQRIYFTSYKGSTYTQQFYNSEKDSYYFYNHYLGTSQSAKPSGSLLELRCGIRV